MTVSRGAIRFTGPELETRDPTMTARPPMSPGAWPHVHTTSVAARAASSQVFERLATLDNHLQHTGDYGKSLSGAYRSCII